MVVASALMIGAIVFAASRVGRGEPSPNLGRPTAHPPGGDVHISGCRHLDTKAIVTVVVTNHSSKRSNYYIEIDITRDGQRVGTARVGQSRVPVPFGQGGDSTRPKVIVDPQGSATVQATASVPGSSDHIECGIAPASVERTESA